MTEPRVERAAGRRRWPWWGRILGLYAGSRIVSTALLAGMFALAKASDWPFASRLVGTNFLTFLSAWDASFYRHIAVHGYPTTLPSGAIEPNAWAFLPVFPFVTRGVMNLTGLGFDAAGIIVATLAGAGACLALFALVRPRATEAATTWTVVLFCFGPLAFILELPYADGLFCLLIFAALAAMTRHRYALVGVLGVVAAFTRPGALALALALGIHFIVRVRAGSFPMRQRVEAVISGVVIAVAGSAWPYVADWATGGHDVYLRTELSWWTGFVGHQTFVPLTPWFLLAGQYFGIAGILLVVVALAGFAWWMTRPSVRSLGSDLVAFSSSYLLYLVAVFLPQQSLFRVLMPLAPLLAAPAGHPVRVRALAVVFIALQPVAIVLVWFLGYP